MGFIKSEGKFNENWYLLDAQMFGMKGNAAIYIIENKGSRLMVDTTTPSSAMRKILKKIKELGLYPIHKLLLTHSHWDHIESVAKLKSNMKSYEIEVLASEYAIDNLENPQKMNQEYDVNIEPIENVIPLKEGNAIDLEGLELEIYNLFGHSHDLIGFLDRKNKIIFAGDAVINKYDYDTFLPVFLSNEFDELELKKTFAKIKKIKEANSISLSHFGVWTEGDFNKILEEMEDFHFKTKESLVQWYNENSSLDYITSKYRETFIPNSTIFTKENLLGLKLAIRWLLDGLKKSGFIKITQENTFL
ncbi:MAG: MBL fold metallo-hydrolase [Candidatus Hermodarchaeota archaeon]